MTPLEEDWELRVNVAALYRRVYGSRESSREFFVSQTGPMDFEVMDTTDGSGGTVCVCSNEERAELIAQLLTLAKRYL